MEVDEAVTAVLEQEKAEELRLREQENAEAEVPGATEKAEADPLRGEMKAHAPAHEVRGLRGHDLLDREAPIYDRRRSALVDEAPAAMRSVSPAAVERLRSARNLKPTEAQQNWAGRGFRPVKKRDDEFDPELDMDLHTREKVDAAAREIFDTSKTDHYPTPGRGDDSLQWYLEKIGQVMLLQPHEVAELSESVQTKPRNPRLSDGIEGGKKRDSDTFTHKNSGKCI